MATLTIRDLEPEVKERLRVRAAKRGHSMEEEARVILRQATLLEQDEPTRLADAIRARFEPIAGAELTIPRREPARRPPSFR